MNEVERREAFDRFLDESAELQDYDQCVTVEEITEVCRCTRKKLADERRRESASDQDSL